MRQSYYAPQRNVGWGLDALQDSSTRCTHITRIGHPRNRPCQPIVDAPGYTWSPIDAHVVEAHAPCHGRPQHIRHGRPHACLVVVHHGHIWASTSHFTWSHAIARMGSHALPYTPTRDCLWTPILVHFVEPHVHGWTPTKFRGCPRAAPFTSSLAHLHPRSQPTHVQHTSTVVHISRPSASMFVSTFVHVLRPASSTMLAHISPHVTTSCVHIRPASAHVCPSATTIGDHSRPTLIHAYP